jgi:hypothetical protein
VVSGSHTPHGLRIPANNSEFSIEALRGSPTSGHHGLVDVTLPKKEALGHLCHKLPFELGFEGGFYWLSDVRTHLKDHASYKASRGTDGLTWRNTLNPAKGRYVAFAEDLLYGTHHDQHVKALCRAGKTITAIDTFTGLSEALADAKSLLATEQKEDQKSPAAPPHPSTRMTLLGCLPLCSS